MGYKQDNKTQVMQSYKYHFVQHDSTRLQIQTKTQAQGSHHVNNKKTRQFNLVWTGMTHQVNSKKTRQFNLV